MIRTATILAAAVIATSASAQHRGLLFDDPSYKALTEQIKPYEAKTTAPDPNLPKLTPMDSTREPLVSSNKSLLDGCIITAIGRIPQSDGLRVINTATEHRGSTKKVDYYAVGVLVELRGKQATFQYTCEVFDNTSARLVGR